MGNSLSPRQSSSKRRADAFANLPATPSTRSRRRKGSAIDTRDTATTSVSTAASDESAARPRRQKGVSAAPTSPRRGIASARTRDPPRADHSSPKRPHAHLPGPTHAMVAGSMAPDPSSASSSANPSANPSAGPSAADSSRDADGPSEQLVRIRRAEGVLRQIADEYAAKRAAGLVPSKPVPARTLLWEELARQQLPRTGRRGLCVFGRDSGAVCGCSTYGRVDVPSNTGGICECCGHGAPWHRLTGGTMWSGTGSPAQRGPMSSLFSSGRGTARRSRAGSSARSRPLSELLEASARSRGAVPFDGDESAGDYGDEYDDYDSDYDSDEDEDEDDEDIANEVARPHGDGPFASAPPLVRPLPGADSDGYSHNLGRRTRAESGSSSTSSNYVDRSSIVSTGSNLGLPPRLSSTSRHLDRLLGAIAKYRALGMDEDEIEAHIREDFPPTERLSSMATT